MEITNNEKIDILLATYNTKIEFLKIQIDSILNQTYQNINLIISDDNSTDNEVINALKQYEKKDNRVSLFLQEKNLGYLKNFEFLLNKSEAEYIALADHDDVWYKDKIEKSYKILKEKNADLVYCNCRQINQNGQVIEKDYFKYKNVPIINGKNNILCFSRHVAIGCSSLFTKKIKEQMLPFTKEVIVQDWQNVYLASKQNGVVCIKEPLFDYRLHQDNQFGGRNLKQNLKKWKTENGISYKAYKKYRIERVIKTAYLDGAIMCKMYREKLGLEKDYKEEKTIKYYSKLLKTKIINLNLIGYHKYLAFKGIGKRGIKEKMIFHFPIISYLVYLIK